jgi:type II secretory pathway pseudopilin PulG
MRFQAGNRTLQTTLRAGFTLVELLVAATMCMLMMAILSQAFTSGIDSFRYMRAVGNMQEQLRMAAMVLKQDLSAQHFAGNSTQGVGGSNLNASLGGKALICDTPLVTGGDGPLPVAYTGPYLSSLGQNTAVSNQIPPQGFFQLTAGAGGSVQEGVDSDGLPSYLGTGYGMAMTVIQPGNNAQQQFYASLLQAASPAQVGSLNPDYASGNTVLAAPGAQVIYFLSPTAKLPNGNQLYALYRQQQVVLPVRPSTLGINVSGVPELSAFSLADVAPANSTARLTASPLGGTYQGSDLLLTNVISFEIKAHWWTNQNGTFVEGTPGWPGNTDYPFAPLTYDSGNAGPNTFLNVPNLGIRIDALQIRIRIWDAKNEIARQITITQDM